jgi:hypothetical protein
MHIYLYVYTHVYMYTYITGQDPFFPLDYEPQYSVSFGGQHIYSTFWGRGGEISKILDTFAALPVSTAPTSSSAGQLKFCFVL